MSASLPIYILGIESSCDDTSASVLQSRLPLSNVIATQKVHEAYGGVVPELASRAHQKNIVPVVHQALEKAGIAAHQLSAVAYTKGPGLLGSLLVGASFAKAYAMALGIPLIEVNHMQAHILSHFIEDKVQKSPPFPFLGITISGGHTQIVQVNAAFDMQVIGETLDDAVGEAFDKCGKMMQLDYPAGPIIDRLAKLGNPLSFQFAKPKVEGLNFSFSGLKTSVLYFLQRETAKDPNFISTHINDICASFQYTVVEILMDKIRKAIAETGIQDIAIGGGVSANSAIRKALFTADENGELKAYIPKFEYCTDNAAMIAIVGYYKYLAQDFETSKLAQSRFQI